MVKPDEFDAEAGAKETEITSFRVRGLLLEEELDGEIRLFLSVERADRTTACPLCKATSVASYDGGIDWRSAGGGRRGAESDEAEILKRSIGNDREAIGGCCGRGPLSFSVVATKTG